MADLRRKPEFAAAVAAARAGIAEFAKRRVPDAVAIQQRLHGKHNLQGHAHSVVPLAVLVARENRGLLQMARQRTKLRADMASTPEKRDALLWGSLEVAIRSVLGAQGGDCISETIKGDEPQTARRVAKTYLTMRYGGGHAGGGAGDTVLKRTIKLLAHMGIS